MASSNPTPPSTPQPTTLLVLDDSQQDREILRRLLASDSKREYVIHERSAIETALAAVRELEPDCILLDYALGDGNGLDFLRELRQLGGTRAFPVVMLTGSGNEQIAAEAFRTGAQDYLAKGTINPEVLQRTIAGAIYKAQTERLLEEQRAELERLFREAQEANARKDRFLATLSHELRTPLTPILTTVSSIDPRRSTPDELEEIFDTIKRNIELEARLIDDLLDLTSIAKGKLRLELRPVDAHQIVRHALDTCREDLEQKQLRLLLRLDAGQHTIQADPARLQQVFWNLLKNAVKFTPAGGEIHVITRNSDDGRFEAEVRDTGRGIESEMLPRIFDAFEQGGNQVTTRYGGLGLGLAISRALIDGHHGSIRASSDGVGKGASFCLSLPALSVDEPVNHAANLEEPAAGDLHREAAPPTIDDGPCRVLLVEDHADSARVLARMLRKRGYEVLVAETMAEAIACFQQAEVHAVVSDIGLPDGDGATLIEQLHRIRPVPSVALSGFGMEHDLTRSQRAGFHEHLIKPVDWHLLDAVLTRLIAEHSPAHANAAP